MGSIPTRGDTHYFHLHFHFFALVARQSAALISATQHVMPPELGGKWGTVCLNTRFPLPFLLCAGYSVKLIYFILLNYLCIFIRQSAGLSFANQYWICRNLGLNNLPAVCGIQSEAKKRKQIKSQITKHNYINIMWH